MSEVPPLPAGFQGSKPSFPSSSGVPPLTPPRRDDPGAGFPGEDERDLARWYQILGAGIFLAVLGFYMLRWGLEGAIHNRKVEILPDLKGKSIGAALDTLSSLNLAIKKEGSEFNNAVPIGSILRQTPEAGTKVREGKIIRIVVSQGGETVFAPNLIGLPLRNAEMLLRENQLLLGSVTESYSLRMDKGMVLSEDPRAESSVGRNTPVSVIISGGPPPAGVTLMPDFTRKNVAEATAWANHADIPVQITKDSNSLFPAGIVLAQDPPGDSVLATGAKIKLTVSGKSGESGDDQRAMRKIHYEVPQGSADSQVRIVLVDQYGEQEIFNGLRSPGSKVDLEVPKPEGQARIKVFLNGILVEERDL